MNKRSYAGKSSAQQKPNKPAEMALLAWIDEEISYHYQAREYINMDCPDPEIDTYEMHNTALLRLYQIRSALVAGTILRYWTGGISALDVPLDIKARADWPNNTGGKSKHLWSAIPLVIPE